MPDTFKEGDVIELKSGSPKMTISSTSTDGTSVICTWYDSSKNE